MDSTFKTNKHDFPLVVFSGVDSNNRNIVLGYGFVRRETAESYAWLLTQLKNFNTHEPGTLLTDFDASMCKAIEKMFDKTTHLLCCWHFQQNIKRNFLNLTKGKSATEKQVFQKLQDMIFVTDPKKFDQDVEIVFSSGVLTEK